MNDVLRMIAEELLKAQGFMPASELPPGEKAIALDAQAKRELSALVENTGGAIKWHDDVMFDMAVKREKMPQVLHGLERIKTGFMDRLKAKQERENREAWDKKVDRGDGGLHPMPLSTAMRRTMKQHEEQARAAQWPAYAEEVLKSLFERHEDAYRPGDVVGGTADAMKENRAKEIAQFKLTVETLSEAKRWIAKAQQEVHKLMGML